MSNTIRITSAGNYYANSFDEVTFNANSGYQKNLLLGTNSLGNTSIWSSIGTITLTTNATTAPDGTLTAGKLVLGSGLAVNGAAWGQNPNIIATPQTYTLSVYAKSAEWNEIRINGRSNANTLNSFNTYVSLVDGTISGTIAIGTFVAGNVTTKSVGNGWWYITATFTSDNITNQLRTQFYSYNLASLNGDGSSGIYIWGPQLEINNVGTIYEPTNILGLPASNSVSKIDSNGNSYITGQFDEITYNANSGYQKNLLPYSQTGLANIWAPAAITYTANATIAPDGTKTAGLIQETSGLATHVFAENINLPTANTSYTFSCYIKSYSGDRQFWFQFHETPAYNYVTAITNNSLATFDSSPSLGGVANPSGGIYSNPTGSLVYVGNGWYRISLSVKVANQITNTTFVIGLYNVFAQSYVGNGTSGIYIWGPQVELGNTATIYVPTVSNSIIANTFVQRVVNTGDTYVSGSYDEVFGLTVTNGLTLSLDGRIYNPTIYGNQWVDLGPNNVNVNLLNVGYNSANGGYLTFQGGSLTNYYANTNLPESAFVTASAGTISVWVLPIGTSPTMYTSYSGQQIWADTNFTTGNNNYIWITRGVRSGVDAIYVGNWEGGSNPEKFVTIPYTTGQWINIVWLHTNNTLYGYANGQLVGSVTANNTAQLGLTATIGACPPYFPSFSGYMGKVQTYNRALSPAEIQQNFTADRQRFGI